MRDRGDLLFEGLSSLLLRQEKVQQRLITQLERLELRDSLMQEALHSLRKDMAALYKESKEYHHQQLRAEQIKIQTDRAVLKELRDSNGRTTVASGQSSNLSYSNESRREHKLLNNQNAPGDDTFEESTINNMSLKSAKREGPPLQHMQSCVLPAKIPPKEEKEPVELPKNYSSNHLAISFESYRISSLYDYEKLVPQIACWTGHLYSLLSQRTYEMTKERHLTKQQMKVFFSASLIYNSVTFMGFVSSHYPYIWRPHRNEIMKEFTLQSKNSLKYLMVKYAVNRRECVDHWCDQFIHEMNQLHSVDNDSLTAARIRFEYNKDKHYAGKIKEVLNLYIRMTKKFFGRFQQEVNKCVTINPNASQQEYGYTVTAPDQPNGSYMIGNSKVDPSFLGPYFDGMPSVPEMSPLTPKHMYKSRPIGAPIEQPLSQPTKTLKTLIGSKFRSNTGLYMPDELKEKGIKIKTAEVLRVLIKWIDDLEKKVNDVNKYTIQMDSPFPHREFGKDPVSLTHCEREMLRDTLNSSIEKFRAMHQENNEIRAVLAALHTCIAKNKGGFPFIPQNQVVVGLATYILSEPVSKITVSYLESLIHCVLEGESNFNAKSNRQPISLISFGVYDLLRARCTGTKEEITEVYSNLAQSSQLKIVRVKNRLDSINRDFLLNVKLVGTPLLCEIQLEIDNQSEQADSQQKLLSGFSHFLYELDRSKYGPLIQAVITNNHLCPTIPYFEAELKEYRIKTLDFEVAYNSASRTISVQSFQRITEELPFTCSNCWRFIYPQQSFMQSFEQEDRQQRDQFKRVCGECVVERLPRHLKKQYLLGQLAPAFEEVKLSSLTATHNHPKRYVCLVLNGIKKNVRVLQLHYCPIQKTAEFLQTFLLMNRCGEMYELQDLSICYAFQLGQDHPIRQVSSQDLSPNDIVSNSEITIQSLASRKQTYLAVPLANRRRLILDELQEGPSELSAKQCRINNLRGICQHLKQETETSKQSRTRIKDFVESEIISISGKRINCLVLFLTSHLKQLNVSNNLVAVFNVRGFKLDMLEQLNITSNLLKQIILDGQLLPNLHLLRAGYNLIETVEVGAGMPLLGQLYMQHNRIESVEALTKLAMQSLKTLVLDYNQIRIVSFKESNMPLLKTISAKHNSITEVDGLSSLVELEELNLSTNFLQQFFFDGTDHAPKLQRLDLSNNRLSKTSWSPPFELRQLNLQFNYLQTFQIDHFQDSKLERLNLCNPLFYAACNRIAELVCDWNRLAQLKDLQLEKNKLVQGRFDRYTFKSVPYVKLMETRRSLLEFSDEQMVSMLNWQLNQLPPEHADSIVKFVVDQKDVRISMTGGNSAPLIRLDFTQANLARELISSYSLMPEENPIASARPEFRSSSLSIGQATRFRRLIQEIP